VKNNPDDFHFSINPFEHVRVCSKFNRIEDAKTVATKVSRRRLR